MPAGFTPASVSAISGTTFWVLGTAPCRSAPCTSLVRTTDGGKTFAGLPAPRAALPPGAGPNSASVSDVRFADARNGWAFGRALWSTHDGGATWKPVPLSHQVIDLAASGGTVWAVVADCGGGATGCRNYAVDESPVSRDGWSRATVPGLPTSGGEASLAVRGATVYVSVSGGAAAILASTDGGAHFARHDSPCAPDLGAGQLSAAPGALWVACPTGMLASVSRSTDGGAHFTTTHAGQLPNSSTVAAIGPAAAVVQTPTDLLRSTDGGAHYTQILGASPDRGGSIQYAGFTNPSVGYAIVSPTNDAAPLLDRTVDGGSHWSPVSF